MKFLLRVSQIIAKLKEIKKTIKKEESVHRESSASRGNKSEDEVPNNAYTKTPKDFS